MNTSDLLLILHTDNPDLQLPKNEILRHRLHEIYYERPSWSQIS
ncbi:hypothetical protein [uncultured Porphyromonas sp.]|nr:hypothetical protein [uncultured Porphyromonas sp.]